MLQLQYAQREQAVAQAEAKVRDAHTSAQKRAAEAEAREAKVEAQLKRLEMVRNDPVQFLSEAGITEEEFKNYLSQGGKQTPEQRRLAETEKQMRAIREELQKMQEEAAKSTQAVRREREDAEFMKTLDKDDFVLVQNMGGVAAVRNKQAQLARTLGRDVTLEDAAGQLEREFHDGLQKFLKNGAIRTKLGLSTPVDQQDAGSKPSSPRTLNGSMASATNSAGTRPAWNDWAAKKANYLRDRERTTRN